MLWHRGDPAGWTWHKSLGAWFDPSIARKAEDLRELLLMTLFTVYLLFTQTDTWNVQMSVLTLTVFST